MNDNRKQILEKAINYDSDILIRFYLQVKPSWNYFREQYVQLYFEARRCFFNNCPRAATIMAGDSLERAILDRIVYFNEEPTSVDGYAIFLDPKAKEKTSLDMLFKDKDYSNYELVNKLTFHNAIELIEQSNLYSQSLLKTMHDVRALRNMATHKGFALIDQWDPDDHQRDPDDHRSRSDEEFMEMLRSVTWGFPEGYRMLDKHKKESSWIYFDCRKYNCTMKELSPEERVAAIQLQLVQEVIKAFSSGEIDEYRYQNQI